MTLLPRWQGEMRAGQGELLLWGWQKQYIILDIWIKSTQIVLRSSVEVVIAQAILPGASHKQVTRAFEITRYAVGAMDPFTFTAWLYIHPTLFLVHLLILPCTTFISANFCSSAFTCSLHNCLFKRVMSLNVAKIVHLSVCFYCQHPVIDTIVSRISRFGLCSHEIWSILLYSDIYGAFIF